jgi:aminotransferase
MDASDKEIVFDEKGVCNHCKEFGRIKNEIWFPNEQGLIHIENVFKKIKIKNKNNKYDCILGISGGVDSSYLALVLKKYNLRVLVVHVDAGWNSEIAVSNIENIINYCGFDLYTHVVNWESMRKLQVAYLKSGVANQDVPQDHVFTAVLFKYAVKNKIKTIMSGGNYATESVFPSSWHGNAMDKINLMNIYNTHGSGKLNNYDTISFFQYYFLFRLKGMQEIRPLNFLPFLKKDALVALKNVGWRNYGRKHGESLFTRFFQNYFLPERFGYDKRRPHYSSMILSGEMSRNEAIKMLEEPLYLDENLKEDINYFCNKLNISSSELKNFIDMPLKYYDEYKNWDSLIKYVTFSRKIYSLLKNNKL